MSVCVHGLTGIGQYFWLCIAIWTPAESKWAPPSSRFTDP